MPNEIYNPTYDVIRQRIETIMESYSVRLQGVIVVNILLKNIKTPPDTLCMIIMILEIKS